MDRPYDINEQASRDHRAEPEDFACYDEVSGNGPSTMDHKPSLIETIGYELDAYDRRLGDYNNTEAKFGYWPEHQFIRRIREILG